LTGGGKPKEVRYLATEFSAPHSRSSHQHRTPTFTSPSPARAPFAGAPQNNQASLPFCAYARATCNILHAACSTQSPAVHAPQHATLTPQAPARRRGCARRSAPPQRSEQTAAAACARAFARRHQQPAHNLTPAVSPLTVWCLRYRAYAHTALWVLTGP
jgi:hypothetical protein